MARVSIVVTARDMTGRAFRAINARAHRLGRSFTTAGSSGTGAFRTMFQAIRRGFTRSTTHSGGFFRSIRRGASGAARYMGRQIRRGVAGAFRAPGRLVTQGFRGIGRLISGMMEDGIGQGLRNAFQGASSNPYVMAGVAIFITAIAAYLATALAGVLVMAFGAAFVGLGGFIAAKSQVVKNAWSKMVNDVKNSWHDAGAALEPVITHGIGLLHKMADAFLPHFKEAMRHSAGPLQDFLDHVADGIKQFGKRAFKPMMDGFDALLLAFGPQLDDWMLVLGDSFKALGNTVKNHSGEIAMAIRGILNLVTWLIDTINFLTQVWMLQMRTATYAFGVLITGLGMVIKAVLFLASAAVDGFTQAFGWIPGLGGKLKSARKHMDDFADSVTKKLFKLGQEARDWGKNMDKANRKRALKVDIAGWKKDLAAAKKDLKDTLSKKAIKKLQMQIKDWTDKLAKARKDLTTTTKTKAKAKLEGSIKDLEAKIKRAKQLLADQSRRKSKSQIKADISDLSRKIASARRQLNALNGKTAHTYVVTSYQQIRNKGYNGNSATGGHAYGGIIGGMAHGGLSNAMAGLRGVLVGEQGPEFVQLPTGSRVRPAGATRAMLSNRSSGGAAQFLFKSSGRRVDDLLLEILREAIHQRGGDPVKVLGG